MIFFGFSSLVTLGLAALSSVAAYPDPGACTGACTGAHDPCMVKRADGTYFRFNTGSEIGIWTADAITGPWVYQGAALESGSKIDLAGNTDLWAPDVHLIGDTYVMFYTVSVFGSQASAIGYATSSTMEYGSWTDHGSAGVTSSSGKAYNAVDPNLIEVDGEYFMNFGSFYGDIFQVSMNSAGTKAASSAYNIAYNASGSHAVEGSYMYYRAPYYYLFFSSGSCCGYDTAKPAAGDEYAVHVCRSSSATGSFVDADGVSCTEGGGTLVLGSHGTVYGPGGQGIMVDSAQGGSVMYYHYADTSIGLADAEYQFGWNTISWSTGWPVLQ
ncbi:unnamed protein product [Discula destructiva]